MVCYYGNKEIIFQTDLLTCILIIYSDIFDKIDNFAFIVFTAMVPVF